MIWMQYAGILHHLFIHLFGLAANNVPVCWDKINPSIQKIREKGKKRTKNTFPIRQSETAQWICRIVGKCLMKNVHGKTIEFDPLVVDHFTIYSLSNGLKWKYEFALNISIIQSNKSISMWNAEFMRAECNNFNRANHTIPICCWGVWIYTFESSGKKSIGTAFACGILRNFAKRHNHIKIYRFLLEFLIALHAGSAQCPVVVVYFFFFTSSL